MFWHNQNVLKCHQYDLTEQKTMKLINASINLDKIPVDKIKQTPKGRFVDVTIVCRDEPDEYDQDTAIQISQTKEERERKDKRTFIGNGKTAFVR